MSLYAIDLTKAGWLERTGKWRVTEKGRKAFETYTRPLDFWEEGHRLYENWYRTKRESSKTSSQPPEAEARKIVAAASPRVTLGEAFERALVYAFHLHLGQLRKGTRIPYVAHLLGVTSLVLEMGGGEDEAIAALLHDSIEDAGATKEGIAALFGERVAGLVDSVSERDDEITEATDDNWCERKTRSLTAIGGKRPEALRVLLADKLYNIRSLLTDLDRADVGRRVWARFRPVGDPAKAKLRQLWYYRELLEAFEATEPEGLGPFLGEFRAAVVELELRSEGPDHPEPASEHGHAERNGRL